MDAAAEIGRNPYVSTRFSLSMKMSRLARDGTAEPVSRDQILRRERGQGDFGASYCVYVLHINVRVCVFYKNKIRMHLNLLSIPHQGGTITITDRASNILYPVMYVCMYGHPTYSSKSKDQSGKVVNLVVVS